MIVVNCAQGSEQWHKARSGVVTASMFKVAREKTGMLTDQQQKYVDAIRRGLSPTAACTEAGYKKSPTSDAIVRALDGEVVGAPSEAACNYAFKVAIERISGEPLDEGFQTWQMKRGNDLEPDARMHHELAANIMVVRAGFVMTDDGKFGGSADGLIGDDEGSEYKCLVSPKELREVLMNDDISEYIDQIQGCLWLTGRKRWHFCMYCPALAPIGRHLYWRVVDRDDAYIESLESDLIAFERMVSDYERGLRLKAA